MKHNWEYKILTDCIEKVKYTNKIQSSDYKKEGLYPIISQEDEYISGYCDNESDLFKISKPIVIFGDHTRIVKYIDFDFVLGADGVKILQPIDNLSAKFFSYFLKSYPIPSLGYSRHFKVIKEISIPVPSLPTQQSIVSELDSLSKIIADCKETLKDYNALEQSIFYDMFGDPVKNEKGWEVKKVIDVVTMQRGFDLPSSNRNSSGHIPVYGSNGILGMHNESKLSEGIITGRSGSIGEVYVSFKPFWPLNTTLFSKDTHGNNLTYLQFLLRNFNLKRFAEGAGVPTLNRNNFHNENIIAPHLPLQQQFASKIEAIEQMKSETKKALQEAETLFQARMDYWFN
ncbi:MAG: restriction endonuclease subunit S [Bacteroidales bacterium]|nr:restriction endonuclease subunit S [Bacteroidales bacterium]